MDFTKIKIETNENGVSLWYNGRWILDASTVRETGTCTIRTDKNNIVGFKVAEEKYSHLELQFGVNKPLAKNRRKTVEEELLELIELGA